MPRYRQRHSRASKVLQQTHLTNESVEQVYLVYTFIAFNSLFQSIEQYAAFKVVSVTRVEMRLELFSSDAENSLIVYLHRHNVQHLTSKRLTNNLKCLQLCN